MSRSIPTEGLLGTASQTFSHGIERSGEYLSEQGLSGLVDDASQFVRRNPLATVVICLGVGYWFGRMHGMLRG